MPWAGRGKHRLLVEVPPRAWLGDGMPRCERISTSSTGADHTRIAIDDWDGDGRLDIVFGESYGCLFWFPNLGTAKAPDFRYYRMLFSADGLPMDAGMGSAPLVVDWDGDGRKDLLVGTHWNRVLFFRNDGTSRGRRLTYGGFIEVEGKPLELPIEPVVGHPKGIFKRDYYPVLAAADWNGDGRLDLLAGGYVTGRIYLFENVGQERTGLPRLASRGPLEADGKPLNVGDWCAAPTIADFDTDGDFDLISGCTPVTPSSRGNGKLLRYYQNVGTARAPELIQQPFPGNGQCRLRSITSPRAGDGSFGFPWGSPCTVTSVLEGRGAKAEAGLLAPGHHSVAPSRGPSPVAGPVGPAAVLPVTVAGPRRIRTGFPHHRPWRVAAAYRGGSTTPWAMAIPAITSTPTVTMPTAMRTTARPPAPMRACTPGARADGACHAIQMASTPPASR